MLLVHGIFLNADLIKLDVEGSEYQILDAAKEDIFNSEPILFLIEMRRRTNFKILDFRFNERP